MHCRVIAIEETSEVLFEMVEWNNEVGAHTYLCEGYNSNGRLHFAKAYKAEIVYCSYDYYWDEAQYAGNVVTEMILKTIEK